LREIYENSSYLNNNPSWHAEDSPWKAKQILRMINENSLKPSTIAEVGCGAGEILNTLFHRMDKKNKFVGYEMSSQAYQFCRKKAKPGLKFLKKDITKVSCKHDILLAIDVFEHVEDFYGFLKKIRSKATYKIFHIPLDLSVQTVLRNAPIMKARKLVGHIHYFTKQTALAALEDSGYKIMDYRYTASSSELPNRDWKARIASVPRGVSFFINRDLTVRILGGYSLLVLTQ
jgi:cyclopropane fatty-acyl-phospholipid synthase-like methyltransferase